MSESPVASKRALRSLVASASDPTHNPCSHAVVATAPEVLQAPGERTPKLIKPTIVYPISPGGTEIRPPPIAAAPRSPDVKAPVPGGSPPYPCSASNLPRRLPSLPAPPEVPSDMRGTGLRVEGDSVAHDAGAGQGAIGGRSEGREGFEWFYDGLTRVFASHSGEQDGRAEEVKTSTAELQKLVINDGDKDVSPLLAGDWLTLAGPVMKDLSPNSAEWWKQVLQASNDHYQRWLISTPVERLSRRPDHPHRFEGTRFSREEQRGLHLILKAIPNSLKEELVSTQRMSCIDAVAKIFCTYQPGGLKERSALLRFLTTPESSSDVNVALKHLKRWARWYRRAEDLQVSLPDSTLLLAGLDLLTSKALSKFPETQFRLSSFRYSQNIDMVPTSEKVCALAEMLQAELEVLDTGVAKGTKAARLEDTTEPPKGKPKAKARAACKHWMTPDGCRFAGSCTFAHSPLGKGDKRCFSCSSTEHFKDACPYRGKGSAGDGEGGSKGKGSKGGKKGSEEQPKGDAGAAAGAAQTAAKVEDTARQDMFREVTAAIKQLTQSSSAASVKTIAVGVCPSLEGLPYSKPQSGKLTGLLDSGATLCVRPRRDGEEPVERRKVALAEGETYMGVSAFGTLIGSVDSEPIVSMSKLVRLGFHVAWRQKTCTECILLWGGSQWSFKTGALESIVGLLLI